MSLFDAFSSHSSATTNDQVNNNQVGATEGALAFGANTSGDSVTITNSDADTVGRAADAITKVASDAITSGTQAAGTALMFGDHALSFADDLGSKALDSNSATTLASIQAASNTTQQANDLLSRASESYSQKLLDNSGVAPQTLSVDFMKYILYGIVAVAAVYLITKTTKKSSA